MEQFKRVKVVMLSTNKFSRRNELVIDNSKLLGIHLPQNPEPSLCYSQHLYIISDDEIKESDWYIVSDYTKSEDIGKATQDISRTIQRMGGYKKIIATTDTSLEPRNLYGNSGLFKTKIPQPSQQFIEKYIEEYNKGNIITDVLVEYEDKVKDKFTSFDTGKLIYFEPKLKINPKDNTITIKKVKDSWNREEVINKLYLMSEFMKNKTLLSESSFNKWIEENL